MGPRTARSLVCPLCHGPFDWEEVERVGEEVRSAKLRCPACATRAAVREGFGIFLPGDASEAASTPREGRAIPLGEGSTEGSSGSGPPKGWPSTSGRPSDWLVEGWAGRPEGPLELGPGPGESVPRFAARATRRPIVVEPEFELLAERRRRYGPEVAWDGIVAEAHSLPLADRSVPGIVSEFGLQHHPGSFVTLRELRRVSQGPLLAVAAFLTEETGANARWAREAGVAEMYLERACLEAFRRARWNASFEPRVEARLEPPVEADLGGARFPRVPEIVWWGLLRAE